MTQALAITIRGMLTRIQNPNDIYDDFVVYRSYRFSPRHLAPFNKTKRGQQRRAERRFKVEQRGFEYVQPAQEPLLDYLHAIEDWG